MRQITVWILNTEKIDLKNMQKYRDMVSIKRWEKVGRLCSQEQKRSLGAGILLQKFCQKYGLQENQCQYLNNGKPCFNVEGIPDFNISHSGDYAVLVYINDGTARVGADIQEKRKMNPSVWKRVLSKEEEKKELSKKYSFIQIWTVKESYVKMTGEGLKRDFREIAVDDKKKVIRDIRGNTAAYYQEIPMPAGYAGCICCEQPFDIANIKNVFI